MDNRYQLILATDCGGTDRGRYEIAAHRCFFPYLVQPVFFETTSLSTLHCGFVATAHALSTVDHFGPLRIGENIGLLVNAAPERDDIYALELDNGVQVVGPHLGFNFHFLRDRVRKSYLVRDTRDMSGKETPFRSMEIMVPALAVRLGAADFPHLEFVPQELPRYDPEPGVYVADWDSHDNLYLVSTGEDESWIPALGETRVFRIGNTVARLRHVDGIFAGETGEQVLTTGSLRLNGKSVHYIVVRGSRARAMLGNPTVGTKVLVGDR